MIEQKENVFTLENRFLCRKIEVGSFGVRTNSFFNKETEKEYLCKPCREFAFSLNRHYVNSISESRYQAVDGTTLCAGRKLEFMGWNQTKPEAGTEELQLKFHLAEADVTVHYRIYDRIPGMRKWLTFAAREKEVCLENLVFDDTLLVPGGIPAECDFYQGNQFVPAPVSFTNDGAEDIICCCNPAMKEGVLTATTAPGPLRFMMCYPEWNNLLNGCSMSMAPFAKFLKPGIPFDSPASLIAFFRETPEIPGFTDNMRRLIRAGLPAFKGRESVMFCTWMGYETNVSEQLMFDLADRSAELGIDNVVLDLGWFSNKAVNREPDPAKFPHGLKPIAERLHEKGIAFGLWVNIGHDSGAPLPDGHFDAQQADDTPKRLGWNYETAFHVQCFASGYREIILEQLDEIATNYKVDYYKFDASSILSPYGVLPLGCHAANHEHHRGFSDSIIEMFAGMRYLREKLQKRHPGLLIDFSFESFGTERPTIAALEYSDLNHITNDAAVDPKVHRIERIRRNFYRHTGALPPERLLHGLLALRPDNAEEVLLTSFVGAPLISGDILKIPEKSLKRMQKMIAAFHAAVENGPLTSFEVLSCQKEIDSFRRFSDAGAEILCVFNRTENPFTLERDDLKDAETSSRECIVSPHDCKIFWKGITP